MALMREMIEHRLHDGMNLVRDEESRAIPGFGFVILAERALASHTRGKPMQSEALRFLLQAAALNVPEAFYRLGVFYENGVGVERNLNLAARAYRKAHVLQGNPRRGGGSAAVNAFSRR